MGNNRFEYNEVCPTCRDAGIVGEDSKPVSLGFDIDTSTISCIMGHEFDSLPSETVAGKRDDGVAGQRDGLMPEDATNSGSFEASEGVKNEAVCHSLEAESAVDGVDSVAADSEALAQLSQRIASDIGQRAEGMAPPARAVADEQTARISENVMARVKDTANGVRQSNGDLAVTIFVAEQWAQAVVAEAEIQNMTVSDYLSQQVGQYLADFWTSNYTNTR